jgi:hypothetical protein
VRKYAGAESGHGCPYFAAAALVGGMFEAEMSRGGSGGCGAVEIFRFKKVRLKGSVAGVLGPLGHV